MRHRSSLLVLPLLGFLMGCQPAPANLGEEGASLMQRSRAWSEVMVTGDLEAIVEPWAEDAVLLPPDSPPLEGKAAIRNYVEAALQVPGFRISWEPVSVSVARSGDMAHLVERTLTTVTDSLGNIVTTHGKAVTVWRKDPDGVWRNVVDIWNATSTFRN